MSEDPSFLRRWAQRKAEALHPAGLAPPPPAEAVTAVTDASDVPAADPLVPAVDAVVPPLPPIESLDATSDYRPFLAPGVDAALRAQALRKLFHQPEYNVIDPLNDYIDDFTDYAPLGDVLTADLRHRLETEAEAVARRLVADAAAAEARDATVAVADAPAASSPPVAASVSDADPEPAAPESAARDDR